MKTSFIIGPVLMILLACEHDEQRYLVVSKIKSASKLATTETIVDKVVLGTQERKMLGIVRLNTAYFAASTQAVIKAGIDLSEIEASDVIIEGRRISIVLPHVRILNFNYPFSSYKIDSTVTRDAFLNKIDVLDHERFYMMAELDIRNNLKYYGIKETTEQKTRMMMEGLLKNLGYEEIHVSFKQGELIKEIAFENQIEE